MPGPGRAIRSLGHVQPGEQVCVDRILYGILQDLCDSAGLHEGDVVVCRRASPSCLVLEVEDGRRVVIDQDWARFIRVRACDDPERRSAVRPPR